MQNEKNRIAETKQGDGEFALEPSTRFAGVSPAVRAAAHDPLILEPVGAQDTVLAHPDAMLASVLRSPDFAEAEAAYAKAEAKVEGMVGRLDFATDESSRVSLAAIRSIYDSARQRARSSLHKQCEQALNSVDRLVGSWEGTTLGLKEEISILRSELGEAEVELARLKGGGKDKA